MGKLGSAYLEHRGGPWVWMPIAAATAALLMTASCAASPRQPDPMAASTVDQRATFTSYVTDAVDELASSIDGDILGRSSVDQCYAGQRNWKVDTGYDHRCTLTVGVLIGTDGDFRSTMRDVDASLQELGWVSSAGEWPGQLVDRYWDLRAAESPDGQVAIDRLPAPFSVRRDDLAIRFSYGGLDDRGLDRLDRAQRITTWCCGPPFHEIREPIDLTEIAENQRHRHLILITVEGHYLTE